MRKHKYPIRNGDLLLATPFMEDGHFKKAVILICNHNKEEGTLGFVINKEMDLQLNDLMADFPFIDTRVYFGGPVATDTIHYIHDVGGELEGSVPVCPGIWWGGDFDQLKDKVVSGLIDERNIRFFVGYSGWSPGQLGMEIKESTWVISDMRTEYLHHSPPLELWYQCMEEKGTTFSIMTEMTPDKMVWS